MNNFNGQGLPLDDKRLTLSGTTQAGRQQYRIWRDSQQILVPRGQSITKPHSPENVQANVGVFGSIEKGYFQNPIVEFRNTNDYNLFDRFQLVSFRDEFPDDPDTPIDTFGFYMIDISFILIINFNGYQWDIPMQLPLVRTGDNIYITSDAYNIATYGNYSLQGGIEYELEFNTFFHLTTIGTHNLGVLNLGSHLLSMTLQTLRVNRGSSAYLYNPTFNPTLPPVTFVANDVKLLGGWG